MIFTKLFSVDTLFEDLEIDEADGSHSGYTRVSTHTLETLGNGNPHFGFFVGPEAGAGLVHLKI